jgi:ArsR family transcriptional regulator, zinc-responsive transcriptional repressor
MYQQFVVTLTTVITRARSAAVDLRSPTYSLRSIYAWMQTVKAPGQTLPPDQVALAVEVFRMLADGTRIQILRALIDREMPVNEIAETIGKPGTSVSQHLTKLRMARLVRTRRDGTQIFYQLDNDHVRELIVDAVHHAGPAVPTHHLARDGELTSIPDHRAATTGSVDNAVAGG